MLITSKEGLEALLEARTELETHHGRTIPEHFYRRKLAQVWNRARSSTAYADIGEYSPEAFATLPVTPKQRLKDAPWEFTAAGIDKSARYYETTGTTGKTTPTPRLLGDIVWNTVSVATAWSRLLEPGARVLSLLPSDVVPVGDLAADVSAFLEVPFARAYPFATGISDWDRLVSLWSTFRPTTVFLAPGVLLQATRLFKQRGILDEIGESVTTLMLLGEVSVAPMRARVGQWWRARAFDASYGSTETGTLAAACERDRLHLLTAANHFEVTDGDDSAPPEPGAVGRLVVTPLNLHARPLLRFDTGDRIEVLPDCRCGDRSPVIEPIGRASDGLRLGGVPLSPRRVEEVVYGATTATGYLMETDAMGRRAVLLLERDVNTDRTSEAAMAEAVRRASAERLGIDWERILFVNTLPAVTKSGGSQKSWKRSNLRITEG
jgi:phenylacetate-CoA ligase